MIVNFLLIACGILLAYCIIKRCITGNTDKENFLSKRTTDSIKGIAIIMVAFSHVCQAAPELVNILWYGEYTYTVIFTTWGGIGVAIFFLLSGYGCYLSITKSTNILKWLAIHVVKLFVCYCIAFVLISALSWLVPGDPPDVKDLVLSFITLKIPGTLSWYFKIQLLFYALLALSVKIKPQQCYLITLFVVIYAIVAMNCGLSDFWWKTSLCFATGSILAKYKDKISTIITKNIWFRIVVMLIGFGAFIDVYTGLPVDNTLIPLLIAFVCIACSIVITWDWLIGWNRLLARIGAVSLSVYLVHIGAAHYIYSLSYNVNIKTLLFLFAVVTGTITCDWLYRRASDAILGRILVK